MLDLHCGKEQICSLTNYEKRDEAWAWLAWHWLLQALYWAVLAGILNNGCFTNTCLASLGRPAFGRHPTRTSSHGSQRSALRPAAGETACVDVAGGRGHMLMVCILFPHGLLLLLSHSQPPTPLAGGGWQLWGGLELPHTLPSPLGGSVWLIPPAINTLPSSPPLSSLLISYPLFYHAIPQPNLSFFTHTSTPPSTTHTPAVCFETQAF